MEVIGNLKEPHVITLESHFSVEKGRLTVLEKEKLPFNIKRVYWVTENTNEHDIKGNQANREGEILIACLSGEINITLEKASETKEFILNSPQQLMYIPPMWWREIEIELGVILLVMSSKEYGKEDLIQDKEVFRKLF